ncbi:unnamed protein product, partial [Rotaria magnacalcarata]
YLEIFNRIGAPSNVDRSVSPRSKPSRRRAVKRAKVDPSDDVKTQGGDDENSKQDEPSNLLDDLEDDEDLDDDDDMEEEEDEEDR